MATDQNIVLACVNPPSIWNFYDTIDAARADMARANAAGKTQYEPMTYQAYKADERTFYLADSPVQITQEKFIEMLEVLPPLRWNQQENFESFLMSEFWSGTYTHQYVRRGHGDAATYWTRLVDAADRSTWITA